MATNVRPEGSPWMVPYLTVKDADKALDFYNRAFGFQKRFAMPGPDGKTAHAEMTYKDMLLMFSPEGAYGCQVKCPASLQAPSPTALFVYCESVDELCQQAKSSGAQVAVPPTDMFWGDRMCSLIDPDGHTWNFATHTGKTFEHTPGKC